jgi:hypothetical protein
MSKQTEEYFVYNGGCCEAYRFELLSLALAPC